VKYFLVYSQDAAGNSEQYDDDLTPEKCTDQRQHYGDTSGQHSLCNRRTRSEPFRFRAELELCQSCVNKWHSVERETRNLD
jgi:hypothetical protein